MSNDETYNGRANRETWAVALHINNDQGWQESVLQQLREATLESVLYPESSGVPLTVAAHAEDVKSIAQAQAGEIIRENVDETLDMLYSAATDTDNDKARSDYTNIREDIGSLWRVDWTELGRSFLEDLADIDADEESDPDGEAVFTNYPGRIYLDPETGEFSGTAEGGEDMPSSS